MRKQLLFTMFLGLALSYANAQDGFYDDFAGNQANHGTVHNGTDYGAGQATITFENNQLVSNYSWTHPDWFQRSAFYDFDASVDCSQYPVLEVKYMVMDNDFDSIPVRFDLAGYGWIADVENENMEANGDPWELKAANGEWNTVSDNFTTSGRWFCTYYNGGIEASPVDSTRIVQFQAFSHYGDAALYTDIAGTLYIDYVKLTGATGTEEIIYGNHSLFGLALYPNPAKDNLNVNAENSISSIRVFDLTGKMVEEISGVNAKKTNINVSDFNSGLYFVTVEDENGNYVSRKVNIE